ncbi:hypothetical protein SAMN05444358_101368 [Ruegeria halocynthiae]|uniref:Uncharacterized protein n=1 Tax=Ruegeria halocynthiae TaxID=985054 RepID=A0A1H2S5Z0_9RHOB|nr:hypothetical protein [Ruegeria halocynthiae]SDW27053.1 hypothetical protein SAMN05444358_101368 [Ruegeria halocynthiae]
MTAKHTYHGGLQFDGSADGTLERLCEVVSTTLGDYGHLVERKTILSTSEASIVSSQYLVRLTLDSEPTEPDHNHHERMDRTAGLKTMTRPAVTPPGNRLTISINPVSKLLDDSEISELMLVVILYRMVDICTTRRVEWLSPKTVLTIEQFMSAFDSMAPRSSRNRKQVFEAVSGPFAGLDLPDPDPALAEVEQTKPRPIQLSDDQLLSIAFRTETEIPKPAAVLQKTEDGEDRPSDILRLTSWGMTGAIASISTPIALSLAAVNLIRGEDFRLNTQVLSFTAAIYGLNVTNAFAEVASVIGI